MVSRFYTRPNILMIVSDDQGYWAMGCSGNDEVHTPYLDNLAKQGTLLTHFYTASPVCSPARASLLTGRMPSAHGVHDFLRPPAPGVFQVSDYLEGLATTPDILYSEGWRCGLSGKWHLGSDGHPMHGFEHVYVHAAGAGHYNAAPMWRDGTLITENGYITDLITDDAISFLTQSLIDDEPFYSAVHYTAPHSPWIGEHPSNLVSLYKDCPFLSCPHEEAHAWWSPMSSDLANAYRDRIPSLQGYYAAITGMDRQVGRLITWLDDAGIRSSTFVVFVSDNGFSCGHHGIWGKGNSTWPLNMFEESVRVPAIISQPGVIPSGVVCESMISGCDLHPTILSAAGVASRDDPLVAGKSIFSLLVNGGTSAQYRDHLVIYDEYGDTRMVRTSDWKYVYRGHYGPGELYSVANDPKERDNLYSDPGYANVQNELYILLRDWFTAHVDPEMEAIGMGVTGAGQVSPYRRSLRTAKTFYSRDVGESSVTTSFGR